MPARIDAARVFLQGLPCGQLCGEDGSVLPSLLDAQLRALKVARYPAASCVLRAQRAMLAAARIARRERLRSGEKLKPRAERLHGQPGSLLLLLEDHQART